MIKYVLVKSMCSIEVFVVKTLKGGTYQIASVLSFICALCQAFLAACYSADNLPLKSSPDIVANFGTIVKQLKVRKTSKELRPVATPQASASSSAEASGFDPNLSLRMMTMMLEQAKALDSLKNEVALTAKLTLPKASSSQSLASADVSPQSSSVLSPKALDPVPDPLPLPAPPAFEDAGHGGLEDHSYNNGSNGTKSLEDYERIAKEKLSKKAKEMDEEIGPMKKPSSRKAPKAEPKGKMTKSKAVLKEKHGGSAFHRGIFGCIRCRGNIRGCDTCRSPTFGGLRFTSRDEYNKWYQKKQHSDKKRK